jgi:hypothetical protein
MGRSHKIQTGEEFLSFQLLELTRIDQETKDKYFIWWNGLKSDFKNLSDVQLDEIIAMTMEDSENTKSESELREIVSSFIKG